MPDPPDQDRLESTPEAEEVLRRASAYARSLIEASLDPLVTIGPDGKITDVNAATEAVTGYARGQLIGTDFSEYFTEPGKARAGYEQVFREGAVRDYPLEIRHRDGRLTSVLYNAAVYRDDRGKVIGVFAAARDITERKRAEEAHTRLAAIVESSDDAILSKSLDGTILSWNCGAERIYGYGAAEVLGRHITFLVPEAQREELAAMTARVGRGETLQHFETVRIRKDGQQIAVSLSLSPIKDAGSRIVGVSTIARDVTPRKVMEDALRRANTYTRSLIEASLDPLVTIGPDGTITDVNAATTQVAGLGRKQLIGTDFAEYFTDPAAARAGYREVFAKGFVTDYPLTIRHRDGRLTEVLYNASVYTDEHGQVLGVFAAARDITKRKRAEEALRVRTDQLRALASELTLAEHRERRRLAEVLHDDLQQLLVAARLRLRSVRSAPEGAGDVEDLLTQALGVSRSLTRELSPPILREGGVLPALQWLAGWMAEKHDLKVDVVSADAVPPVGDDAAVLIFQTVRELLLNVVKHAQVRTATVAIGQAGTQLQIDVTDTGVGFEPARFEGRSLGGFGLFSIRERLELLSGRLEIESASGKGSRVTLLVPLGSRPPAPAVAPAAPSRPGPEERLSGDGERIRLVVVDDHVIVRQGLVRLLAAEPDLEVVGEASDGQEALRLTHHLRPQVIIMDVGMQAMNGIEATRAIHAEWPTVQVIGLSMYEEAEQGAAMRAAGAVKYISKLGPSEVLLAAIRACVRPSA